MASRTLRVAVVGGGWAGMAAAVTLARAGMPACVFESAGTLGGRARTVLLHEAIVDNGQHILLGAYRETLALMRLVNPRADESLLRLPLALDTPPHFSLHSKPLPAPWHVAAGLLTAKGLTVGDRLRAMIFLARIRRARFRLVEDAPLSEVLARHGQTERLNRLLWHPLCLAALNTPPQQAAAQVFLNVLRDSFSGHRDDSDLLLPRGRLSSLFPNPAAAFVQERGSEVHLGCRVRSVDASSSGLTVSWNGEKQTFSHVICAVPPFRAQGMLSAIPAMADTIGQIGAFSYQPIYTIYLQYPAAVRLSAPMLGLADSPGQWVFDHGHLAGAHGLLAVVVSAHGEHETVAHGALADAAVTQLANTFGLTERPIWQQVIAEKRATFACTPNLRRPSHRTSVCGLYLAGDYVAGDYPATIEGAVRSGVQCAREILEKA